MEIDFYLKKFVNFIRELREKTSEKKNKNFS